MINTEVQPHRHSPCLEKSGWKRMTAFLTDRELYDKASMTGECELCKKLLLAPNADYLRAPLLSVQCGVIALVSIFPIESLFWKLAFAATALLLLLLAVFLPPFILAHAKWKPIEMGGRDKMTVICEYKQLRKQFAKPAIALCISALLCGLLIAALIFR